jgi:hypothetical protein
MGIGVLDRENHSGGYFVFVEANAWSVIDSGSEGRSNKPKHFAVIGVSSQKN